MTERLDLRLWLFAALLCMGWLAADASEAPAAKVGPDAPEAVVSALSDDAFPSATDHRITAPQNGGGSAGAPAGPASPPSPFAAWLAGGGRGEPARPAGDAPHGSFLDRISYRTTGPPLRIG